MIVIPGPGWALVFVGLGILATEFHWARRALRFFKGMYDAWKGWMSRQHLAFKLAFGLVSTVATVATIWLFNGLGYIGPLIGLDWAWLHSPLSFF